MSLRKAKLEKLVALNTENIMVAEGYIKEGFVYQAPVVGMQCKVDGLITSRIEEIMEENGDFIRFRTLNSIYDLNYEPVSKKHDFGDIDKFFGVDTNALLEELKHSDDYIGIFGGLPKKETTPLMSEERVEEIIVELANLFHEVSVSMDDTMSYMGEVNRLVDTLIKGGHIITDKPSFLGISKMVFVKKSHEDLFTETLLKRKNLGW